MHRVVVTGMAGLTPIGQIWSEIEVGLRERRSCVQSMPEWDIFEGLNAKIAAPLPSFSLPSKYNRKSTRSMGRVAILATRASELAIERAGLTGHPILSSGQSGIAYGSSSGSPPALNKLASIMVNHNTDAIKANTYIQLMPHTTVANISVFFGICGRFLPTSSACTSGSLAIGTAFETIRSGQQKVMLAGGAEELCPSQAAVFDALFATSTRNDAPTTTPRPFDAGRDGMVIGEGAATFVLEELEHARDRGAPIFAEIVGFGLNCDGQHVTQPTQETMTKALSAAIQDAGVSPEQIGYVNAHGTATDRGDIAESHATRDAIGYAVPISSLKSYFGHTLGACGSIEAWLSIEMMNGNWFSPTINLSDLDGRCADLDYLTDDGREIETEFMMTNNFAFGGVNTSLIFKRWPQ